MFSQAIFKRTIRTLWRLWAILTAILIGLFLILSALPMSAKIVAMMIQQFYTLFSFLVPVIFIAIVGNKLVAAQVDDGSLSCALSSRIKRNQFSCTQAFCFAGSLLLTYLLLTLVGLIVIPATGASLEIPQFLLLNLGSFVLNFAFSGIAFFASCFFNSSRYSLAFGAGIPLFSLLMEMIANLAVTNSAFEPFKYLTLNSLFNMEDILAYSPKMIWEFLLPFFLALSGYIGGILVFKKKDLPL